MLRLSPAPALERSLPAGRVSSASVPSASVSSACGEQGFSIAELLVAMLVGIQVLVVSLIIFDMNSRIAQVQTDVSEVQQSQRGAQDALLGVAREAGRGFLPQGWAISVDNNVAASYKVGTNEVVDGTDVLIVRGVVDGPLYQVNYTDAATWSNDGDFATLVIDSLTTTGLDQPLNILSDAIDADQKQALVLVDTVNSDLYAVAMLDPDNSSITSVDIDGDGNANEERATIRVETDLDDWNDFYLEMSADADADGNTREWPDGLNSVAYVGVLSEYRFYIRDDDDLTTGASPKLSRGHFYPNSDNAFNGDDDNTRVDIADNVIDLQVALGIDRDGNLQIDENVGAEDNDDWLFNHASDSPATDASWNALLRQIRVNVLTRTERPDWNYLSPAIGEIEDSDYSESEFPGDDDEDYARRHRRRLATTVVDVRNLS